MIRLERILVPTDFSAHSQTALNYACEFTDKFGAELHLLHVVQDLAAMVPEPGFVLAPAADYQAELQASAEKELAGLLDPQWAEGKRIIRETRHGVPFVEIVRYAKAHDIDLIVIGTHGRTGIAHALLGSVAEKVVRKAHCPVLTVRPSEHQFVMP